MKTCIEMTQAGYGLKLEQSAKGLFRVTYGQQVVSGLSYEEAAKELGECLMHALTCEGLIDND